MVSKCKICGQYRMRVNEDGVCQICISSRNKDDLSIVVKGLEKQVKKLQDELLKTQMKIEKQDKSIETIKKYAREIKNGR